MNHGWARMIRRYRRCVYRGGRSMVALAERVGWGESESLKVGKSESRKVGKSESRKVEGRKVGGRKVGGQKALQKSKFNNHQSSILRSSFFSLGAERSSVFFSHRCWKFNVRCSMFSLFCLESCRLVSASHPCPFVSIRGFMQVFRFFVVQTKFSGKSP